MRSFFHIFLMALTVFVTGCNSYSSSDLTYGHYLDGTYQNNFFGLSISIPSHLEISDPHANGTVGLAQERELKSGGYHNSPMLFVGWTNQGWPGDFLAFQLHNLAGNKTLNSASDFVSWRYQQGIDAGTIRIEKAFIDWRRFIRVDFMENIPFTADKKQPRYYSVYFREFDHWLLQITLFSPSEEGLKQLNQAVKDMKF